MDNHKDTLAVQCSKQSGIKENLPNTHFVFFINGQTYGLEGGRYLFVPENCPPFMFAHELGHSIGFLHALLGDDEYGDKYSLMGGGLELIPAPNRQFARWLSDGAVILLDSLTPVSITIKEIVTSSAIDVIGIAYKSTHYYQKGQDRFNVLYAEYYRYEKSVKIGKTTQKVKEGKVIVRAVTSGNDIVRTLLLAVLGDGESYVDNTLDNIRVSVHGMEESLVTIDISS
jgi:hypothetical protein